NFTHGLLPPSSYWEGRFSSGPVWNEYLAKLIKYDLHGLAIGGSTSDGDYSALLDLITFEPRSNSKDKVNKGSDDDSDTDSDTESDDDFDVKSDYTSDDDSDNVLDDDASDNKAKRNTVRTVDLSKRLSLGSLSKLGKKVNLGKLGDALSILQVNYTIEILGIDILTVCEIAALFFPEAEIVVVGLEVLKFVLEHYDISIHLPGIDLGAPSDTQKRSVEFSFKLPGVGDQISDFNTSTPSYAALDTSTNDVAILQSGATDLLVKAYGLVSNKRTPSDFADTLTSTVVGQIDQLHRIGFKNIVVVDMPAFQHSPAASLLNVTDVIGTTVNMYNAELANKTNEWASGKDNLGFFGVVELGKFMNITISSAAIVDALGLKDTTTSCFGGNIVSAIDAITDMDFTEMTKMVTGGFVCSDPSTSYFFDFVHIGERVHRLFGYYTSEYIKALQNGKSLELSENTLLDLIKNNDLGTDVPKPVKV
ncbi:hypothetical protein GGF43_006018, partial [Coemansia sp. RSA 2618]